MAKSRRTVLITGCSDGGLGANLAVAFQDAGFHVYATARNIGKMVNLASLGIETLELDVQSESSILACVGKLSSLDILVNNAGAGYSMPTTDLSVEDTRQLFELNFFSVISVTKAFLPLLLESRGVIVHHTSLASVVPLPFQGAYNASKAALAMFSDTQRLELEPFGVRVVELKTGAVKSNFFNNHNTNTPVAIPKASIFEPARAKVERQLGGTDIVNSSMPADTWAKGVARKILKRNPPPRIWSGPQATLARYATLLPSWTTDPTIKKRTKMDVIGRDLKAVRN